MSGSVLDSRWYNLERMDAFRGTVLMTVMPVFFLSTGLRTSWDMGGVGVLAAGGFLLVASVSGKLLGVQIAGRLLGWERGEALIIGWLLQTKALIMIIFANILLDKAIITPGTFTALLLMAVGSTMLTMPMVGPLLLRYRSIGSKSGDDVGLEGCAVVDRPLGVQEGRV
ncbi:cation:proton antiporter domain-containing protein [Pannonibacter sp.]|uniref:cation:proton antiporter domain-containing protein n=1 Tax=Pannonibacter sp. TaxID=1906786 RepID=UPI003F6FB12F